jgi:DNA-binding response OmpR family regulator
MMTSRGGAKHRRAAEQLGATRYFTKPYRDSELATAARAACTDASAS